MVRAGLWIPLLVAVLEEPAAATTKAEEDFLRGNALFDEKRFAEALARYDRASEGGLEDRILFNNRGVALDALGRHAEAVAAYRQSVKLDPGYEIAWYNMGNAQ